MDLRNVRNYEVSIWTLQDDFITVLKHSFLENKGQIQKPELDIKDDGTETFSFSIPMYIVSEEGRQIINENWYSYTQGMLLEGMRKIKVILHKHEDNEEVFEFLILSVSERHEGLKFYCDVTCEGLAFHELGKIGYKISLVSDDFYNDDYIYFTEGKWIDNNGNEHTEAPCANLQYWCNKFLTPLPENLDNISHNVWYYSVEMDWSGYSQLQGGQIQIRDSSKVYEDEYISAWSIDGIKDQLVPVQIESYKEKERLVDLEESNKYNLTQDLAETFNIYCKYIYLHDKNYHITGRRIIFYNNFLNDFNTIDINYKYNAESITRTKDSTDLVTKMFIKPIDSDLSDSGLITIMDVEANKSREDYLLNFDYLHKIKAIDDYTYLEVQKYEKNMYKLNMQLTPLSDELTVLQLNLPEQEAAVTMAENSIQLDKERLSASNDLLNNLLQKSASEDEFLEISASNPEVGILIQDTKLGGYNLHISKLGIEPSSIKMYKKIDYSAIEESQRLIEPITSFSIKYDDTGNITQLFNINIEENDSHIVYLTYKYSPKTYYERVKEVWTERLAQDQENLNNSEQRLEETKIKIKQKEEFYQSILLKKQELITDLERLMGPALREGYWQPDDYDDYGDRYNIELSISNVITDYNNTRTEWFWDDKLFDGEQEIYYKYGADTQIKYYLGIDLSKINNKQLYENLSQLSFTYYDNEFLVPPDEASEGNINIMPYKKYMSFNSEMFLTYVHKNDNNEVIPVLLLTGSEKINNDLLIEIVNNPTHYKCNLSVINTKIENNVITVKEEIYHSIQTQDFLDLSNYIQVFPRIRIPSVKVKNSEDQLCVKYGNHIFTMFEDFSILMRTDDTGAATYISLKPYSLFINNDNLNKINIKYAISNADLAIYLDSLEVMKENSQPKVSYDIKISTLQKEYIQTGYALLRRIVHINDPELHFDHVQGYISEIHLNLDSPKDDEITVKNYKTKFEDLFSKIVASTEQMQKTEFASGIVSQAFAADGIIKNNILQESLDTGDLSLNFNNGLLTITRPDGIIGNSDTGVVIFNNQGIFTSTQKDENGNWIWNSSILPDGINADAIKVGHLDTNKITIYSGDQIRFQMNADGLYAYKSVLEDEELLKIAKNDTNLQALLDKLNTSLDTNQYVVHNENGLFLTAESGAIIPTSETNYTIIENSVDRVEISWRGLILRNWAGDEVFKADPNTGNLTIIGTIEAASGRIGPWEITPDALRYETTKSSSSEEETHFGEIGWNYFGRKGFSIGDVFQIQINEEDNTLKEFLIKTTSDAFITENNTSVSSVINLLTANETTENNNDDDNDNDNKNYLLKITQTLVEEEDTTATRALSSSNATEFLYSLSLKDVELDDQLIQNIITQVPTSYVKTSLLDNDNNPLFEEEEEIKNGTIGVVYKSLAASESEESSVIIGDNVLYPSLLSSSYPEQSNEYSTRVSVAKGINKNISFFNKTFTRWNVFHSGSNPPTGNWSYYSRVGIAHTTSNVGATLSILNKSSSNEWGQDVFINQGTSMLITFNYALSNGSTWDRLGTTATRYQKINVDVYSFNQDINNNFKNNSNNNSNYELIGQGIFKVPQTAPRDNRPTSYNGSLYITCNKIINNNTTFCIIFYSTAARSLIYVNPYSCQLSVPLSTTSSTDEEADPNSAFQTTNLLSVRSENTNLSTNIKESEICAIYVKSGDVWQKMIEPLNWSLPSDFVPNNQNYPVLYNPITKQFTLQY